MPEVIGRAEAIRKNLPKYFTGKPCKQGHVAERYVNGACAECNRAASLARHRANPERSRAYSREYRKTLDENEVRAASRKRHIAKRYGLSEADFESMKAAQNNACAICQDDFIKTPHVDHCHETGRVRGLLCSTCNTGIGGLRDDPVIVDRAAAYLRQM